MSDIKVEVKTSLPKVFFDIKAITKDVDFAIQAAAGVVEGEYKRQSPVNFGDLRRDVTATKLGPMEYFVTTKATSRGRPYPVYLHEGTGSLRGAADYGYTSGRVRAGDVARGIGGIRPNKFAKRAKEKTQGRVFKIVEKKLSSLLKEQINTKI